MDNKRFEKEAIDRIKKMHSERRENKDRRQMIRKMKITIIKKNFEQTEPCEEIIKEFQIIDSIRFLALRFEDDSIAYENLDEISTFNIEVIE